MKNELTIANLALEAPVRKYRIEAILRQKPDLEAPAEACLKALFIAERLSEAALIRYLGLAVEEFDIIAAELQNLFLVRRSGPDFIITQKGKEAIDPNAEGQRRQKVAVDLAFEESSFAEAPRGRSRSWMHRMDQCKVREDGRPEAADAFREGFSAWRARAREGKHGDALARVVHVAPLGRESGVIKAPVALAPASSAAYIDVSRIELGSLATPKRKEVCAERFRETVARAIAPRDGAVALDWIANKIGAIPGAPILDPVTWARRARAGDFVGPDGSILVSETAPSLIARGGLEFEAEALTPNIDSASNAVVIWSPPEGDVWRLDFDIDTAASRLLRETKEEVTDEPALVAAIFRLRKGDERDMQMWSIERGALPFQAALLATSIRSENAVLAKGVDEDLPQALELVVCPGLWAIAIAHLATDRAPIPIPVGIATTDPIAVKNIVTALHDKVCLFKHKDWLAPAGLSGASLAANRVVEAMKISL